MKAFMPRIAAARASACAWLPDEWVATPLAAWWSFSEKTALTAPLDLNAPAFWKFSHLKKNRLPKRRLNISDVSTGVRWI
jgi:hypothetical protein